ncbi:MAG: uracil-DNA glycosylase [Alphaproteobacteria bacterium]|nr:uracil-DNA glycosylase [Alphaproteobacteria bacterium]
MAVTTLPYDAPQDCALCPRLVAFRTENRKKYPDFHNNPVPSLGESDPELLIVGLAPGLKGANRTAQPFTGDFAGNFLFAALTKFGRATGYDRTGTGDTLIADDTLIAGDTLILKDTLITNAVRCVPPQNKTIAAEEHNCRPFLINQISNLPRLKIILALGLVAHNAVLTSYGKKKSACRFAHGATHLLDEDSAITLIDSYHCSRYNINTRRLTTAMFEDVFHRIDTLLTINPELRKIS